MFAVLSFFVFILCGACLSATRYNMLCYISNMYSLWLAISINEGE